jgi:preprotein translocase subunit YajC
MVDLAWAQEGGGQAPSGGSALLIQLAPIALIILIFYFLMIRPQVQRQKAHQAMVAALKKGDKVVTNGGVCGVVVGTKDDIVVLKVAENTKIEVLRTAVSAVRGQETDG